MIARVVIALLALQGLGAAPARADEAKAGDVAFEGVIERDTVEIAPAKTVTLKSVDVDNRLGDVTVVGHDGAGVTLTVVKHAPDAETIERLKVNLIPDPDGAIHISTSLLFGAEARPLASGVVRVDMTLLVPRATKLDVKAWNGKVAVSSMTSGATLAAHDADITVTDLTGPVSTTNTRGKQKLSDVDGAVTAAGTYGEMELSEVRGDSLTAKLHDGTIVATRIRVRTLVIATTFGDISFQGELLAGGSYRLRSHKGSVKVLAGGAFSLDAYSRDGRVDSRVELADQKLVEGRLIGSFGSRKKPALLEIQSTAGSVLLGLLNE